MPIYNKLVRDFIPEIIEGKGKKCIFKQLSKQELLQEMKKKFIEEAYEVNEAKNREEMKEELGDLLELIHRALIVYDISLEELEESRSAKAEKSGGFSKGIYLVEVQDE
ncbi:nucleoside triphosphate pyrophosphohydrolase [Rummeliibacillus stabekisii]|uniref:nucleoside triphosphate pyrophosphohydrolase n=1 Tax=Rummeliibacillus stabekisii TaxID=241244 RepID=UPI0020407F19|nr:nucleoside triphosphate pyrophosphohydrolase [Rummeliibacillus stabekisii]MCM3316563.1 nucleoside triphosphate pyrophosphohydrolase [Rummeliibacillus stabekisii]